MTRARLVVAGFAIASALAGSLEGSGVRFSRLTPCPDAGLIRFQAVDPAAPGPDTLCLDPGTGGLHWEGGPVRGLARGNGDTVYAATIAGAAVLVSERAVGFIPWVQPVRSLGSGVPSAWPATRTPVPRSRKIAARPVGEVVVFPERYLPCKGGSLVFLVEAEHPPRPGLMLYDLHSRAPDGVEWMLRRNLEVRAWVLSPDSSRWALAAREHRPDYGGEIREVILAGVGHQVETFALGIPLALLWDGAEGLWCLNREGSLFRLRTGPDVWSVDRARFGAPACECPLGESESVWVWMSPGRYADPESASRFAESVQAERSLGSARAWVVRDAQGAHRPVWGGHLTRRALEEAIDEPPVPGSERTAVPVTTEDYVGTVARILMTRENGEAVIRQVKHGDTTASELWWRFLARPDWIRLAGPWGVADPGPGRRADLLPVDTPRTAP